MSTPIQDPLRGWAQQSDACRTGDTVTGNHDNQTAPQEARSTPQRRTRPYFVPADLDYETLPAELRMAVDELVAPAYEELVLQAPDALERATAATFVCLLFLELFEQFDLGQQVADSVKRGTRERYGDEKAFNRSLRLMAQKQKAADFLLRVRHYREKHLQVFR